MLKILVPVDLSEDASNAAHQALLLASAMPQSQLLLLHCYQDYLADADPDMMAPADMTTSEEVTERVMYRNVTEAENELEELYQLLRAQAADSNPHTHLERAFIHGLPEDVILEEASRFKPDLVVMGTKGESNIARSFFGTVTTKVVEELDTPILTIPGSYKNTPFKRVAYATDFDKADGQSLAQLQKLLGPLNPEFYCVHVSTDSHDQEKIDKLQSRLQQNHPDLKATYILLDGDKASDTLLTYAQQQSINLVALTTHKRSLLGNILHPSLTQKLVLESDVPLLVFHTSKEV